MVCSKEVGLKDKGKLPIKSYSKGMLQRIGLAQAMLHDPELLILDEPTDGVDPKGRAEIRETLFNLKKRGTTVFPQQPTCCRKSNSSVTVSRSSNRATSCTSAPSRISQIPVRAHSKSS